MKSKFLNYNQFLYISFSMLMFVTTMMQTKLYFEYSNIQSLLNFVLPLLSIFLLFLSMKKGLRISVEMFTVLALLVFISFNIKNNGMSQRVFYLPIAMLALREMEYRKILKAYSIGAFITIVLTLAIYFLGIIRPQVIDGRDSLGFIYSTFGSNILLHATLALIASKKERISFF